MDIDRTRTAGGGEVQEAKVRFDKGIWFEATEEFQFYVEGVEDFGRKNAWYDWTMKFHPTELAMIVCEVAKAANAPAVAKAFAPVLSSLLELATTCSRHLEAKADATTSGKN